MKSIALAPYSVRFKKPYEQDEFLENIDGGTDSLVLVETALNALLTKESHDQGARKVLSVVSVKRDKRTLCGILEGGEYGLASTIRDVVKRKKVHDKERDHADMFRFYYLLSLPKQRTKGILLIQKIGALGVVTPLKIALQDALSKVCPLYNVHIRQLSTMGIYDRFMDKGDLRKIRFVRFKVPKAIEDAYPSGHEEIYGRTELVIKIGGVHGMPFAKAIRKFQNGKGALGDIIELGDDHFEADTIKMEMTVSGKRRTLSVQDPQNMRAQLDISDEVKIGTDGNPEFDSIDGIASEWLTELEAGMYGKGGA
jgi:hypothetical protein